MRSIIPYVSVYSLKKCQHIVRGQSNLKMYGSELGSVRYDFPAAPGSGTARRSTRRLDTDRVPDLLTLDATVQTLQGKRTVKHSSCKYSAIRYYPCVRLELDTIFILITINLNVILISSPHTTNNDMRVR